MSANLSGRKVELTETFGALRPCDCGCKTGTVRFHKKHHPHERGYNVASDGYAYAIGTDCGHRAGWLDQSEIDSINDARPPRVSRPATIDNS